MPGSVAIGANYRTLQSPPWLLKDARDRIPVMHVRSHRLRLAVQVPCLLLSLVVLGCVSKAPPAGVRYPITSGSHASLPTTHQRILIWADPPLADMAMVWLEAHHYSNILLPQKGPFSSTQISHDFSTRKAALAVAKEMQADVVVFLEHEEQKEAPLLELHCGPLFNVSVDVRGLWVKSGDPSWHGNAHYPHCVALSGETLQNLTCQALATAWGFRPSGQLEIPSTLMCTAGQREPGAREKF